MNKEILDFLSKEQVVTRLEYKASVWSTRVMVAGLFIPVFTAMALLSAHLKYRPAELAGVLGIVFAALLLVFCFRAATSSNRSLRSALYEVGDASYNAYYTLDA